MPHIKETERSNFDYALTTLAKEKVDTPGKFVYLLVQLGLIYMVQNKKSFAVLLVIVGGFFFAALDFWHNIANPYEDLKKKENGDVYASYR